MRYFLLLYSFLAVAMQPVIAQKSGNRALKTELIQSIDSILNSQVSNNLIPGAVILVKRDNKVIYKQAFGNAVLYDRNNNKLSSPEKTSIDHLYDIASLTKVVGTTTSIMYLADRKMLSVDDPVGKYIKAFESPEKKAITIRHLLTHTSGIYEWYPMYYRSSNKQQTFFLIGELPLIFPTGSERRYSDLGFTILGQIIEVVSGQSLEQFMQEKIFEPLGMKHTTFNPLKTGRFTKIAATSFGNPYEKRMVYDSSLGFTVKEIDPASWNGWRDYILKGEANDGNAWYANGGVSGAAGLFSTIDDIQRLVDMLLNKGMHQGKKFISAKTVEAFLTMDKFKNGLGWMMDPVNSFMKNGPEGTFGHTGFTGTSIAVVPKYKTSVVLLVNRQHTGLSAKGEYYNLNSVRQQIFNAVISASDARLTYVRRASDAE
ncbi:serine hydrolase domain-containing protein [Flavihumibacter stibioxidans]|nr:serine hydrolase [Flavihumibacter stibioxidans]